MIDPCEHCGSERVAAVLWKQIEQSPRSGNKYRLRCLNCGKWLPCCSAADFQAADRRHVLPADVDPDADDPTVPVADYDGQVDGIQGATDGDDGLRADGGTDDQPQTDQDDRNEFDCPACGSHQTGYPDECPDCGAPYNFN